MLYLSPKSSLPPSVSPESRGAFRPFFQSSCGAAWEPCCFSLRKQSWTSGHYFPPHLSLQNQFIFLWKLEKKYLHLTQQPKLGLLFLCFLEKKKSLLIKEGLKAFHFEFVFPIAPKKAQISSGLFSIISSFTLTYTLHLADIYS